MNGATAVLSVMAAYLAIGLLIGIGFALFGAGRVDPAIRGPQPLFRLFLVPGAALLWPLIVIRWWHETKQ